MEFFIHSNKEENSHEKHYVEFINGVFKELFNPFTTRPVAVFSCHRFSLPGSSLWIPSQSDPPVYAMITSLPTLACYCIISELIAIQAAYMRRPLEHPFVILI